jgi:hypothetical protein
MRDASRWRRDLERELSRNWNGTSTVSPGEMCRVELGLYLLAQCAPDEPAASLWTLLTGHPFISPQLSAANRHMIFNGRHLLQRFKSRAAWGEALDRYREVKDSLRGYNVDAKKEKFTRRMVAYGRNRFDIYEVTLTGTLPFVRRDVEWAEAGSYRSADKRGNAYGFDVPDVACFNPPERHYDLKQIRKRAPLTAKWSELVKTARWMDETEASLGLSPNMWEHRLSRVNRKGKGGVQLEVFDEKGKLSVARELKFDGVSHLVGMVSSGKSTLMDVLAVWAARRGLHTTLVVGDVIGALERAQLFQRLGIAAVPVLGSTRRAEHINSLHKVLFSKDPQRPLIQEHVGFRWLSTACPLDGLRSDDPQPFALDFRPCADLRPVQIEQRKPDGAKYCPLYTVCPYHQGQRDLVDASIWVATPASLVHTRVAEQINPESVRFAELVTRHSDLVIVDEADRVQVQLDEIFSPNQILCSAGGDGWLDNLERQVGEHISRNGRASIAGGQTELWRRAHHQAQIAADAVYRRLLTSRELREWIGELYFFTDVQIFSHLAQDMANDPTKRSARYKRIHEQFDSFMSEGVRLLFSDRPFDDEATSSTTHPLARFADRLLMASDSRLLRGELRSWIDKQPAVKLDGGQAELTVEKLEFALLIAVLANRLNVLLGRWKEVEELLGLEGTSSRLLYRPPLDYQGLIPTTPVGNVLAFQYLHESTHGAATLKFLRCAGVGRWLLLHLHDLLAEEGVAGPQVLLLSGTSWAGGDSSYHVQVPVTGILRAPQQEVEAIADSEFHFLPLRDERGKAIKVSGLYGDRRAEALRQMLRALSRSSKIGDNGTSLLERERDTLGENRRRILLVVGSYKEAEAAREFLERERPDWRDRGEFVQLVPDAEATGGENGLSGKLPRGQVDQFAATGASILIAPLMAIERGHNILNEDNVAAIGAVYFLIRPHPRPQDLSYAVRSLNKWAVDKALTLHLATTDNKSLDDAGQAWRREANRRWRELLTTDLVYSTLPREERDPLTWNLMVSMWQIIGRLVRGGQPARVYFCDAKFDLVGSELAEKDVSLLDEMQSVLHPYFDDSNSSTREREQTLVQELYGPLYHALRNMSR